MCIVMVGLPDEVVADLQAAEDASQVDVDLHSKQPWLSFYLPLYPLQERIIVSVHGFKP